MNTRPAGTPLRIGFLFEFGTLNGGERSLLAILDAIAPEAVIPFAVCPVDSPLETEFVLRNWETVAPPEQWTKGKLPPETAEHLNRWGSERGLQLLHANSLTMARRIGAIVPQLSLPVTGHVRDIMSLTATARQSLQQVAGLIAVSDATRSALMQQGFPAEKLTTIHNGIDASRFRGAWNRQEFRNTLGLAEDAFLAVNIGQICLRKGQDDFARAAVRLKDRVPNLHFLLVGQRHSTKSESIAFEREINDLFEAAGMSERFHRIPDHPRVSQVLNGSDLLVHAARQEPLGRVLLEAAACRVPIVATDVGGTPEILTHGVSAFLVPPNNSAALADGMEWMLSNGVAAREMSVAAEKTIRDRFPAGLAAERTLAYWTQAIDQFGKF